MIIIGFILLAAAVAVAVALIVQNTGMIDVSAFNATWHVHAYWLVVASLAVAAVGLLGLAMMSASARMARRRRRERRALAAENKRLAANAESMAAEPAPATTTADRSGEYNAPPPRRAWWSRGNASNARHVH